ncbi:hypothetical protein TrVE_jg6489 [Triparma verrucosa]|uniref:PX domain-containing protein n=1 Tax=Triparma verrucosa TaxID=1606542 RepID=A0A9W7B775_9STRA|nr:hypothetical protein TrVE_jg6489 [Triparma verrucosa]
MATVTPSRMNVPSYQEVIGEGGAMFTVFVVELETADGNRQFIQRRYNAFLNMHKELKKDYPQIASFNFPTKAFLRGASSTKEYRREQFDQYVQLLVGLSPMPEGLREFLSNTGKVQQALHKSTLRNIVRMQNRPAESDIKTINQLMSKPTMFLKFGRRGEPHWRKFSLICASGGWAIKWETKKKGKTPEIKILSMKEVRFGQHSAVFARKKMPHLNSLSFSVFYTLPNKKELETLDLIAKHPDDFFVWTVGLKHAIDNGGIGMDSETSEWQRQEEQAEKDLMEEIDDFDIFGDDEHNDDDHEEEEDDRLITTGNVMFSWGFNGWGQCGVVETIGRDGHLMPSQVTSSACRLVDHGEENSDGFDIQNIACGGNFTVAVDSRMKAYIWGHGSVCGGVADKHGGSVRRNDHVFQPSPLKQPFRNVPIAMVAAGDQHALFLTQKGEVFACGVNDVGQLGTGDLNDRSAPQQVEFESSQSDSTIKVVAAGHSTSAAINSQGQLFTWGCGMFGGLGLGDEENREQPQSVSMREFGMEVKDVSCGQHHMAAILVSTMDVQKSTGTSGEKKINTKVCTWGWNGCGQLGLGDFVDRSTPQTVEVISSGGKIVEQIVCGAAHCAAVVNITMGELEIQGQLWTWGNGVAAMATEGATHAEIPRPFHLTKKGHESIEVFRIAAGDNFTLVLDDEGGLMLLGVNPNNNSGKPVNMGLDLEKLEKSIAGVDGIVTEIAAGGRHISVLAPKRFAYSSLL